MCFALQPYVDSAFYGNEDKIMTASGVCSSGAARWHMFARFVRLKKAGPHVRHPYWIQTHLLFFLLAGHASCTNNTTTFPTVTTSISSLPVLYFMDVSVNVTGNKRNESDIANWLRLVFQEKLESCVLSSHTEQNATKASLRATSVSTSIGPTQTTTVSPSTTTSTATTSQISVTPESPSLTTMKTTTGNGNKLAGTENTPTTTEKIAERSVDPSGTMTTNITGEAVNENATDGSLFQEIEVSCAEKHDIRKTNCVVTLMLKQRVQPCCILRALCQAEQTSSQIHVVGNKVERVGKLQNVCNSDPQNQDFCVSTDTVNASCENYQTVAQNSTLCSAVEEDVNCSCSAYCSSNDAYYYFKMSIQDNTTSVSNVTSLISQLRTLTCFSSTNSSCPFSNITSAYKGANVDCGNRTTHLQSCRVILNFAHKVRVCAVSMALQSVFQSEEHINFDGHVTRAAMCGDSGSDPLNSRFSLMSFNMTPSELCIVENSVTKLLHCQKGKNVVVLLQEECNQKQFTTPSSNVTTTTNMTTNSTTSSVNVTSVSLNTTTEVLSTTTTTNMTTNPTTSSVNVTSVSLDTTTEVLNTTVEATPSTSTVNTSESSGATNPTTSSVNVTSVSPNTTEVPVTTVEATPSTSTVNPDESSESQANALLEQTRNVSNLNSTQVEQLVSQLESLLSGPTVSFALGNTSINIVSNLLGANPDVLASSSSRIIGIVDTVALKLVMPPETLVRSSAINGLADTVQLKVVISPETVTILSPAVAVSVKATDGSNFQETDFSISDPSNVQVRGDSRQRRSVRTDSSTPQGSIRLPDTITQNLTTQEQQQASRVQFNFYQKSTVFQDVSLESRKLNSGILGASVSNLSIGSLQDDVVIRLRHIEPTPANYVTTCVFWDFSRNDGSGGWNSDGCSVLNSTDNETICGCDHLTNFAILLDLSRQPITSRLQATILTFITYIGCGLSAIFLSVTLLTYLAFGKLRKDIPSKILIQLCLALLLLNLVFLVDAWLALYPDAVGLCISTAWFLHYFLLVSFTWMGLEAIHMYLALVKVFNSHITHYMLKFSLAGWGVPLIVIIIVIAIDKDNYGLVTYGRFTDGSTDDFCWLKNDVAFYVAVVAYYCAIFLFNVVMFVVVLVQLCRIKRQNPHNMQHRTTLQNVRSVVGITILLGLTWGFAFFAWGPANLPFMYLFAIFNSLQGFFIFVFHCAVKENVRRQWRTYLCCGKLRLAENSEWSRTATQKTDKKSSSRLTSVQSFMSSQSNNSSSSSSFLVSDSSEQLNGIGSPFDDRIITADEEPSTDVILNEINRQHRNEQAP